jgi:hypothetical protein
MVTNRDAQLIVKLILVTIALTSLEQLLLVLKFAEIASEQPTKYAITEKSKDVQNVQHLIPATLVQEHLEVFQLAQELVETPFECLVKNAIMVKKLDV